MKNVIILLLIYILYNNIENKKAETKNYFYLENLSITDSMYNLSRIGNINEGKNIKEVEGKVITTPFIYSSPQKEIAPTPLLKPSIKPLINTHKDSLINRIGVDKVEPSQYNNTYFSYTEDDIYNLARVIQNESGGDTLDQYRVGVTILNRIALTNDGKKDFTGLNKEANLNNIIKAPSQFNSVWKSITPTEDNVKRAERIVRYDIPLNCFHNGLYFYSPNNSAEPSSWISANRRKQVCALSANGHIHTR